MAKVSDATDFLAWCITQMEAGGYQEAEAEDGNVPDGFAPDDWSRTDCSITLRYGGDVFNVIVSKRRKPSHAT